MRTRLIGFAAGLAMLVPFAAFAGDSAPADASAPTDQPAATSQQANAVVCRYSYYEGTIVKRPDCRTQHEWDRIRQEEQGSLREYQLRWLESPQ